MQGVPTWSLRHNIYHPGFVAGLERGQGCFLSLPWPTVTHFVNRLLTRCSDESKEVCHRPSICVSLNSDPETQSVV